MWFVGMVAKLQKVAIGFIVSIRVCVSVCLSAWSNSTPTRQIFMKFDIWVFLKKIAKKIQVFFKSNRNKGYFK